MGAEASRYRSEDGEPCIDVRIRSIEQMFDNRDPAPFRERDLDPDLSEYLVDAGEDLVGHDQLRVVFWVDQPCPPEEVEHAFRAHFEGELARLRRARARHRRSGEIALLVAVVLVTLLVTLAEIVDSAIGGSLGSGLEEGLLILGWVLMWRPIEVLVYDWIPVRRQRKVLSKLLAARIQTRTSS
jgi:hypothetical protein